MGNKSTKLSILEQKAKDYDTLLESYNSLSEKMSKIYISDNTTVQDRMDKLLAGKITKEKQIQMTENTLLQQLIIQSQKPSYKNYAHKIEENSLVYKFANAITYDVFMHIEAPIVILNMIILQTYVKQNNKHMLMNQDVFINYVDNAYCMRVNGIIMNYNAYELSINITVNPEFRSFGITHYASPSTETRFITMKVNCYNEICDIGVSDNSLYPLIVFLLEKSYLFNLFKNINNITLSTSAISKLNTYIRLLNCNK